MLVISHHYVLFGYFSENNENRFSVIIENGGRNSIINENQRLDFTSLLELNDYSSDKDMNIIELIIKRSFMKIFAQISK